MALHFLAEAILKLKNTGAPDVAIAGAVREVLEALDIDEGIDEVTGRCGPLPGEDLLTDERRWLGYPRMDG